MKRLLTAAVFSALALSACSADGPAGERPAAACFLPSDVDRWGSTDPLQFWVETRRGDVYAGRLRTVCPTVDWSDRIAIQPIVGRSICQGQEARLVIPDFATRTEVCWVDSLRLVSPDEAARLKHKAPS